MEMKKIIIAIGLMFVTVSAVMAQKQWTLQECIDYALANNITLKKSQLQQQSALEDLKATLRLRCCLRSMRLPIKALDISLGRTPGYQQ